jgi:hemerythrin superfamily protein
MMFNLGSRDSKNAIDLLKADHTKVKELFDQFEETDDRKTKTQIVRKALEELSIHATLEEEFFYPAVRIEIDDEDGIMNEADEEHHVAKVLIAELEEMKDSESHYDAKFTVLAESVRHHIKEEEGEMFPKAKDTDIDFDALGEDMLRRKEELISEGVPEPAEATMVGKSQGRGDSPAKAARGKTKASKKTVKSGR